MATGVPEFGTTAGLLFPYEQSGGNRDYLLQVNGNTAPPYNATITLPERGAYLLTLIGWNFYKGQMVSQLATTVWADGYPGTTMAKTSLLGAPAIIGSEITALSASDPTTAGVITLGFTTTRTGATQFGWSVFAKLLTPVGSFLSA